jgi:hypothetical protein
VLVIQLVPANSFAAGGSISGSVEDTGGSAIRTICVGVFDAVTGIRVQRTLTDANGMYDVDGLTPGSYKVMFRDCVVPLDFASEWNDNVRDESLATPVTVSVGQVTQVNAALDRWGALTGSVEDVGGSAITDICVRAFDDLGQGAGWARTDANGMYTLKIRTLLGTGSYKVRFYDCIGPDDYAPEWNGNTPLRKLAIPVTVTVGQDTEVNAAMDRWGAITGSVEDVGGSAIRDICVRVINLGHGGAGWARTDANGMYTVKIRTLRTQSYKVRFYDCIGPDDYATEWNDNARIPRLATPVTVTVGQDTVVNAAMDRWGAISGTVTYEANGYALANICVRVFDDRGRGAGWARTDSNGLYTVKLRTLQITGAYRVRFYDCIDPSGYIPEFYANMSDLRNATRLVVEIGQTTSGIDAALGRFGSISGTVTDDVTTQTIPDACVRVFDAITERPEGSARTRADGTYSVGGLVTGSYKVEFRDCVAPFDYNVQWFKDRQNWHDADPVDVTIGAVTHNISVALVPDTVFTLSVGKVGSGGGIITSQPSGIVCGSDCTQDYLKGTRVTVTAVADLGSAFVSWSGSCSGAGVQTSVTMDANKTCTAEFSNSSAPPPPPPPPPPPSTPPSSPSPAPSSIGSFSPTVGPPGTPITITGSGFTGATALRFNGVAATFTVNSDTQISAEVPAGASAGVISVTTAGGTTTSAGMFAVAHPRRVTLGLHRSLIARGVVSVTDGFGACRQGVRVEIQRFSGGAWHSVANDVTDANGSYRVKVHDVAGKFRASLMKVSLATGDICGVAMSPPRPHR